MALTTLLLDMSLDTWCVINHNTCWSCRVESLTNQIVYLNLWRVIGETSSIIPQVWKNWYLNFIWMMIHSWLINRILTWGSDRMEKKFLYLFMIYFIGCQIAKVGQKCWRLFTNKSGSSGRRYSFKWVTPLDWFDIWIQVEGTLINRSW